MLKRLRQSPEEGPQGNDSQEFAGDSAQLKVLDLNAFDGQTGRHLADFS
jgi:hypothetical protein